MRIKSVSFSGLLLFVALALTVIVGAGVSQGATNYYALPISGAEHVFAAPYGWNRVQATTLGLGTWVHPGDTGYTQSINARATDHFTGTLDDLAKKVVAQVKTRDPKAKVGLIERTTVCGGHPAVYLNYAANDKGHPILAEQMLTVYGSTAYAATYIRGANESSIHAARASLTTLCGGHAPPGATVTTVPAAVRTPTPTPSALYNINTPQPMSTLGNPAATITPRLGGP
ncbi:MAG: hypothetical protein JO343_10000 [Candidatus Eremiobacteraeota bacterium]|nr:hypothetical protein [Candidatus Eremiobacteraeota bacterium]